MTALPVGFVWGTAATALGAEGAAPASDWARWEATGRAPASGDGNGFALDFADDLALLASLGVGAHRLGIDWARLEPAEGRPAGGEVERIRGVLEAARAAGVVPWASLWEGPIPGWFADEGGFRDDRARGRYWPRFVDRCGEWFGDLVAGWFPVHEPVRWAAGAFLAGTLPPGRREPDEYAKAVRGLLLAQRDAWRQLRGGPPVATSFDLAPVAAADGTVPARQAARRVDRTMWAAPVTALRDGHLRVPGRLDELDVPDLRGCCDLVGFTYRGGIGVTADEMLVPHPPGRRTGDDGWAPWDEGLGITLRRLADELPDRPVVVAGWGVASADEQWRAAELRAAVAAVAEAVADGVDVRGFFHRSAVDGYEPGLGLRARTGLFDRDRAPTAVATTYAELIARGGAT